MSGQLDSVFDGRGLRPGLYTDSTNVSDGDRRAVVCRWLSVCSVRGERFGFVTGLCCEMGLWDGGKSRELPPGSGGRGVAMRIIPAVGRGSCTAVTVGADGEK